MSQNQQTHYAVLNVSNDAPKEVIDAAYRSLCKKHHPDLNRNSPESAARMAQINASYDIVSDYAKRFLYDKELEAAQRARYASYNQPRHASNFGQRGAQNSSQQQKQQQRAQPNAERGGWGFATRTPLQQSFFGRRKRTVSFRTVAIGMLFVFLYLTHFTHNVMQGMTYNLLHPSTPAPATAATTSNAETFPTTYVRQTTAPNGSKWPVHADYIDGYPILNDKGQSGITIDNSKNNTDVFVKLLIVEDSLEKAVRVFYVPRYATFTLKDVSEAHYALQYMDLDSGSVYKLAPFELKEKQTPDGKKPTNIRMTLHKVAYNISVDEF